MRQTSASEDVHDKARCPRTRTHALAVPSHLGNGGVHRLLRQQPGVHWRLHASSCVAMVMISSRIQEHYVKKLASPPPPPPPPARGHWWLCRFLLWYSLSTDGEDYFFLKPFCCKYWTLLEPDRVVADFCSTQSQQQISDFWSRIMQLSASSVCGNGSTVRSLPHVMHSSTPTTGFCLSLHLAVC